MIDIEVRIHDRFSVEFKIGYMVKKDRPKSDFVLNAWMFLPDKLDINAATYSKKQFYRDVKSNIRLITPIYTLESLAGEESLPFQFLTVAFKELADEPTEENLQEAEYQVKMFCTIARSAFRRATERVWLFGSTEERADAVGQYEERVRRVVRHYRELSAMLPEEGNGEEACLSHAFGDEFLSNQIEYYTFELLKKLKRRDEACCAQVQARLLQLIREEIAYRRDRGWQVIEKDSPDRNRAVIYRQRMLQTYVENHLFLNANRKKDGAVAEQVSFSIAAGISMIFATAIAFSFQQKYGNFTMPLFVALVVSYMLKDRIKELTRYYFVHRLAKKYFDNKTVISIKDKPIGWIKEGVDFITGDRVPEEVMEKRDRSDLLEATNRHTAERIILYRTLVRIDGQALDEYNQYEISGIHNIQRFNVSSFILKMRNREMPLEVPDEEGGYETVLGERTYYINLLVQLKSEDSIDYKRFRLILSRNGIEGIEKL